MLTTLSYIFLNKINVIKVVQVILELFKLDKHSCYKQEHFNPYINSTFSRGSNFFQGGGGSNCRFPIETHITCDFSGGVRTACPPLWIRTCSFVNLNPLARNPGSDPSTIYFILFTWASPYGTHVEPGCTANMGAHMGPIWVPYRLLAGL